MKLIHVTSEYIGRGKDCMGHLEHIVARVIYMSISAY